MSDEIEIGRTQMPPCECGHEGFSTLDGIEACEACGLQYITEDRPRRVLQADGYHHVHEMTRVRLDGQGDEIVLMRIASGLDDQRPDHDGVDFFLPPCVAHLMPGGSLYSYVHYCGACKRKLGFGAMGNYCPHCGKGIAHYTFSMGVYAYMPPGFAGGMPDTLPEDLPLWDRS